MSRDQEQVETEYISVADTAKLIRKALRDNFPKQKFSVRSESYSGGASVKVSWWDGVALDDVEKVIKRFEGADFDGMQDLKTYHSTMLTDESGNVRKVHYGSDFVFANRHISDGVYDDVCKQIAYLMGKSEEYEREGNGGLYGEYGDQRFSNIAWKLLRKTDLSGGYHGVERTEVQCGSVEEFYKIV